MNINATKDGTNSATVTLNGNTGNIIAGGQEGQGGSLILKDRHGTAGVFITSSTSPLDLEEQLLGGQWGQWVMIDGRIGVVKLRKGTHDSIVLNAQSGNIHVGGLQGAAGNIFVLPENSSEASIHLNGQTGLISFNNATCAGDITLTNADCAEEFDIAKSEEIDPGTVMVLDQEGKLQESKEAYDKKVAGVISGAGDCKPGIVLDKKHSQHK